MKDSPIQKLQAQLPVLDSQYQQAQQSKASYDLRRGRPSLQQLNLSNALDGCLNADFSTPNSIDARLYGQEPYGIREARHLFAEMLDVSPEQTLVYGNSSLQLIYFSILFSWLHGVSNDSEPWSRQGNSAENRNTPRILCPVPGYDRHFGICERLGIGMQAVPMNAHGPDMDIVEESVRDPLVKGLFCVPRFSNPSGIVYSDETVARIARLGQISAKDFRIFWDNAYAMHELYADAPKLRPIMPLCEQYNTVDNVLLFLSTSKISFSGAGIAAAAGSEKNMDYLMHQLRVISIGSDRVNQLRHVRLFKNARGIAKHLSLHAKIVLPKFELVKKILRTGLNSDGDGDGDGNQSIYGHWTEPTGGYFMLFYTLPGCAQEITRVAKDMGLYLTPANSMYPYGKDHEDNALRLAPTELETKELSHAMRLFVLAVKLVSTRYMLQNNKETSSNLSRSNT